MKNAVLMKEEWRKLVLEIEEDIKAKRKLLANARKRYKAELGKIGLLSGRTIKVVRHGRRSKET